MVPNGVANNLARSLQESFTKNSGRNPRGSIIDQYYDKKLKKYIVDMKLEWEGYATHLDWIKDNLETFVVKVKAVVNKDTTISTSTTYYENSVVKKSERAKMGAKIGEIIMSILTGAGGFFTGASEEFPS